MTRDEMNKLRELIGKWTKKIDENPDLPDWKQIDTECLDIARRELERLLGTLEVEEDNKCFRCKHGKRVVSAQCSYPYQDCDYVPK